MTRRHLAFGWLVGLTVAATGPVTLAQEPSKKLEDVAVGTSTECLVLLMPGDEGTGNYGGFRNTCNYTVMYTHCVQNPAEGSWGTTAACKVGSPTNGLDFVGPGAISGAHVTGGTRVHWFGCAYTREPGEGPDGIWGQVVFDGSVLRGKCRYKRYVVTAPTTKQTGSPRQVSANELEVQQAYAAAKQSGNYGEVERLLLAKTRGGDKRMAQLLGSLYRQGLPGIPRDPTKALYWYSVAAKDGSPDAQIDYAFMLRETGDLAHARAILARLAAQGDNRAKAALAKLDGTAPPQAGLGTAKGTPPAARSSGSGDPIWAACGELVMTAIRLSDPPNDPSQIKHIEETFTLKATRNIYGDNDNADMQGRIKNAEERIVVLEKNAISQPQWASWTRGEVAMERANICQMSTFMSVR